MMTPRHVDLLIAGGCIVTMDPSRRIIENGAVAVDGDTIVAVGPTDEVTAAVRADRHVDISGKLMLPGLIDGHNHPIHYLSKGIADDQPVQERWRDRIWPYEAGLSADEVRIASIGTFMEMIRHGTTCFHDPGTFHPDAVAEAALEVGIRGVVSRLAWDKTDPTAPDYSDTTDEALAKGMDVIERWHGAGEGRLKGCLSLVRSAHVTDDLCLAVKERADALGVGIHGHLCTTKAELEASLEATGRSSLHRYERLGILGSSLTLVHMGWIEARDIETLVEHDVSVCHCPSASMFGGFGCIGHGRFPEMIDAGVRVILGSDACAISRFVDMIRIMYLAACGHKDARHDPTVIGAYRALEMATLNAARSLLWADRIGSLEPGKAADMVVFDCDGPTWHPNPLANPVADLIYGASGSDASMTIVAGRIIMENGRILTVDEDSFYVEAGERARAILGRSNLKIGPHWPVVSGSHTSLTRVARGTAN